MSLPWSLLLLLSFIKFSLAPLALAHGVRGTLYQGEVLAIEATYSDGAPMTYARVKVFFDGEKIPFQTGMTDRYGRFAFAPARKGLYRLIIEDGEGHRLEISLNSEKPSPPPASSHEARKTLLGLILIFTFFGLLFFLRKK